ncbi:T9SS type A sorting domain-containing protein [bacterium SCSIO 12741]|nr:T9SS type A sorting domain-containing protein [bacterium SCSIO 12741]
MKSNRILISLGLLLAFAFGLQAQTDYEKRLERMHQEEGKIKLFIQEHLNDPIPESHLDQFYHHYEHEDEHHGSFHFDEAQKEAHLETLKKQYWRVQYFIENPDAYGVFEAKAVANCNNGDFELGNFTGYSLASGNSEAGNGYSGGECSFVPTTTFGSLTPETPLINTDNLDIVGVGTDPYAPIQQINPAPGLGGNYAARINGGKPLANPLGPLGPCRPYQGVNRLSRTVTLTSSEIEEIGFYYALVLEYPNHVNGNPFFLARALDASGNELDRVCRVSDPSSPFFGNVPFTTYGGCSISQVVYSDWTCDELEVSGSPGDVITLEFYAVDCAAGAHFGYAYVDDICEPCIADSCNFTGSIDLNPSDTCFTDSTYTVCGSFEMAVVACTSATVNSITLNVIQGATSYPVTVTPVINMVDQTFCFTLTEADFPFPSGSYDFEVAIEFGLTGGTHTETDIHTQPGIENDVSFDCCDFVPVITFAGDTCYDPCENPEIPVTLYVIDAVTGEALTSPPYTFLWDDGATTHFTSGFVNTPVSVTVTDTEECSAVDSILIECDTCHCELNYFNLAIDWINRCEVSFSVGGFSFTDTNCYISHINWDFGDGNTTTLAPGTSPVHTYSGSGDYLVCATAVVQSTLDQGCFDTLTRCVIAHVTNCQPCDCDISDFTLLNPNINGCTAAFSAISPVISSSDCQPTNIIWDFGDGGVVTLPYNVSPVHNYSSNGVYTVCATYFVQSTSNPNCIDHITKCITITINNCHHNTPQAPNGNSSSTHGELQVYPNPTDGDLHVQFQSDQAQTLVLEILTVDGQVLSRQEQLYDSEEIKVSTHTLSPGSYLLKVIPDLGNPITQSFIKE